MKVLVVGSGGREHALAWKLKQSPKVGQIYIAPGNAGTALVGENISVKTITEIVGWLEKNPVDLVVVGPDSYLAGGIVDEIQKLNIPVFGPTKAAAEIEWSKSYAKQFMQEEGIPTAAYAVFSDAVSAKQYIRKQLLPLVIKADGLAFGKGVVIARTFEDAERSIEDMLVKKTFGAASSEIVIEEYLEGFEISIHAFCDGENFVLFPVSKDHKRIFDGDTGLNTGGMGTIAPVPGILKEHTDLIEKKIVAPTLLGLKKRGRAFSGVLYPGVMLTKDGPKVIEFNARFGDPETQSYMRLLETDLFDTLFACTTGTLSKIDVQWDTRYASCVVLASRGYPEESEKGFEIKGLPYGEHGTTIFHSGTTSENGKYVTSGGRVLGVTAVGTTLQESLDAAYQAITKISFDGMQYRKDVGRMTFK